MIINGLKTRESSTLVYRMGNPSTDVDVHGKPVDSNYIVIVNRKDCTYTVKDGIRYIVPNEAPAALNLAYGGTFYGYGEKVLKKSKYPKYIKGKFESKMVTEWYEARFYAVKKGVVYTTTIRSFVNLNVQRDIRIESLLNQ